MASVTRDGDKGFRIRFYDGNGERQQIRIAGINQATADKIGRHVKVLNTAKTLNDAGHIDRQTALWLADVPDKIHSKLVAAGLTTSRQVNPPSTEEKPPTIELGTFLAEFRNEGRKATGEEAAELTIVKWRAPMDALLRFFGDDRDVTTITHEDAHQFRKWLDERRIKKTKAIPKGVALAENTKRKHIDNAKVFFNAAKRRGLIVRNPFENLVSSTRPNRQRDFFLTAEDTERIIETCPDAEWRLLVSLWRYAGLRKMEIFELTWGDVLWNQGRMRVQIPKTKHHEGKDVRYVPLRDIRQNLLDAMQAQLTDGAVSLPADSPVITRFSKSNSNLDKPMKAILHRAGLVPWPKLFQNMRASCETAWLNEGHPAHVVAAWIGHSVKVQRDHYAQVTDDHYAKFNGLLTSISESGPTSGPVATRTKENPVKRRASVGAIFPAEHEKTPKTLGFSGFKVAAEGLEPPTRGL